MSRTAEITSYAATLWAVMILVGGAAGDSVMSNARVKVLTPA